MKEMTPEEEQELREEIRKFKKQFGYASPPKPTNEDDDVDDDVDYTGAFGSIGEATYESEWRTILWPPLKPIEEQENIWWDRDNFLPNTKPRVKTMNKILKEFGVRLELREDWKEINEKIWEMKVEENPTVKIWDEEWDGRFKEDVTSVQRFRMIIVDEDKVIW